MLKHLFEKRQQSLEISQMENPNNPITGALLSDVSPVASGVRVTEETAMRQVAVLACLRIIAGTAGTLPLHVYETRDHGVSELAQNQDNRVIWGQPNREQTRQFMWETAFLHCVGEGNAYLLKVPDGRGIVTELWPLEPWRIRVGRATDGTKVYQLTGTEGPIALTDNEIIHIPAISRDGLVGINPIRAARETIGMGIAAERAGAGFFGRGSILDGVLETDIGLKPEQADALKARWKEKHAGVDKAYEVAVLDNGAKYKPIGVSPADAQFLDTQRFTKAQIATLFGVAPHLIGDVERSTSWGSGIEQQTIGFVIYNLRQWLVRFEQAIDKHLLPDGRYVKFAIDGLLRGDSQQRSLAHMRSWGRWRTANEIRALEDLPPVDGGDVLLQPMNMEILGAEPDPDNNGGTGGGDFDTGDGGDGGGEGAQ